MKSLVEFAASRRLSYGLPHLFEAGELAGEAGNTLTFQLYRRPAKTVLRNHATFTVHVQHPDDHSVILADNLSARF
jgi:hypothetical protein